MMSTECVQNAANAAAKRRELRRRRLLQGSEDRMKKIMGYSLPGNGMNFLFSFCQAPLIFYYRSMFRVHRSHDFQTTVLKCMSLEHCTLHIHPFGIYGHTLLYNREQYVQNLFSKE